jgi:hypothetical protein
MKSPFFIFYTLGYFRIFDNSKTDEPLPLERAEALDRTELQPDSLIQLIYKDQPKRNFPSDFVFYCTRHGHSLELGNLFDEFHEGCLIQGPFPDDDELESYTPGWKAWVHRVESDHKM